MSAAYCYHGLLLLIDFFLLYLLWRDTFTSFLRFRVLAYCGGSAAICFALVFSTLLDGHFDRDLILHGLAWHGSFFLFASAFLMYRQRIDSKPRRLFPSLVLGFGCIYCGLAVDALLFEPTALIIRETTIRTSKITKPMTIVFASDLHAERIGHYERWTLQKIKEQNADLILFGGDYLHGKTYDDELQLQKYQNWNRFFRELDFQAPLGIYAVRGSLAHDWGPWTKMFADTKIIPCEHTFTEQIGEIRVTFLSMEETWQEPLPIPDEGRENQFRIIVGHSPRYAMATQEADLLLAGHTHGGQVQIPLLGLPIITFSGDLPKKWATGITAMSNGATLIVSHGTGCSIMRIRFWCRPDFWVIRLVPE